MNTKQPCSHECKNNEDSNTVKPILKRIVSMNNGSQPTSTVIFPVFLINRPCGLAVMRSALAYDGHILSRRLI